MMAWNSIVFLAGFLPAIPTCMHASLERPWAYLHVLQLDLTYMHCNLTSLGHLRISEGP